MKKCSLFLLILLIPFSLFANGEKDTAAKKNLPVELRFTVWTGNEAHLSMLKGIGDAFTKENPTITVKFDTIPYDSYVEKVTLQGAGNNPPDCGWLSERFSPGFINAGALSDVSKSLVDVDDLAAPAYAGWRRGDKVYGVPFSTSPMILFYNEKLFQEAGVPTPKSLVEKGEWNWVKFREISRTIKEKTGKFAYVGPLYDAEPDRVLVPIFRAYGVKWWDDKGAVGITSPAAVEAATLYHKMIFEDKSIVPPRDMSDFFAGDVAMAATFISSAGRLKDVPWKWDIVQLPSGPAGDVGVIGQSAIVAWGASKHPEAAAKFVGFITNKANVATMSKFFPPIRKSVLSSSVFLAGNPAIPEARMKAVVASSLAIGELVPVHEQYAKIKLLLQAEMDKLWTPNADVAKQLKAIETAITPLMK